MLAHAVEIINGDLPVPPKMIFNIMPFDLRGDIHGQLTPEVAQPMVRCVKHDPPFIHDITIGFLALYTIATDLVKTIWSVLVFRAIVVIPFDKSGHICIFIASFLGTVTFFNVMPFKSGRHIRRQLILKVTQPMIISVTSGLYVHFGEAQLLALCMIDCWILRCEVLVRYKVERRKSTWTANWLVWCTDGC